ncbi:MAG TPA: hypothetical protein VG146_06010 [Verrucomicrobiae bacterium]|nr:hypothetical protein [Verrucomicrobiae bacterium]
MNLDELQRKLIAAGRAAAPSPAVPYTFSQRVMARLRSEPLADVWELWARALWRAAAPCVALMLLLGAWSLFSSSSRPASGDLSQDLENTVMAGANQEPAAN